MNREAGPQIGEYRSRLRMQLIDQAFRLFQRSGQDLQVPNERGCKSRHQGKGTSTLVITVACPPSEMQLVF